MLRVSKLTDYATVVLAQMARSPDTVHTASDLAERTHLSQPTVAKLLKKFVRGGLLTSYRGAHGGYLLARPPQEISAVEIIDTVEGQFAMTECSLGHDQCDLEQVCNIGHHWQRINGVIRSALNEVSLADLATPAAIPLRRMDFSRAIGRDARTN